MESMIGMLWKQKERLDAHPLFREATGEELERDIVVPLLTEVSEEGQKVARNRGQVKRPARFSSR